MKVTLYDDEPRGMRQRQNVIDLPLVTLVRSDAEKTDIAYGEISLFMQLLRRILLNCLLFTINSFVVNSHNIFFHFCFVFKLKQVVNEGIQ